MQTLRLLTASVEFNSANLSQKVMIFGRKPSGRQNADKNASAGCDRAQGTENRRSVLCQHALRGFTLIETLVTMAVASALMAVAVPSFTSILTQNRMLTQVNAFSNDLSFARSEAMREGLAVSACPSSNGTSCSGGNSWKSGWIIFADPTASGTLPNGASPMRVRAGFAGGDTFTSSITSISFNRDGFAMNLPAGGATIIGHTSPANSAATRCVALSLAGSKKVQKAGTGSCA